MGQTRDLFLVMRNLRSRWALIEPLASDLRTWGGSAIASVGLFVRPETDTALVSLALDPRFLTRAAIMDVTAKAKTRTVDLLEPSALPEVDRGRFYVSYLAQYPRRVEGLRTIEEAFMALRRELGITAPVLASVESAETRQFEVRFCRDEDWQIGRIGRITASDIVIATGSPPRRGDLIRVEVTSDAGAMKVVVAAEVTDVRRSNNGGSPGFKATFAPRTPLERHRLEELFIVANAAPQPSSPPRRGEVRIPLCWPVLLNIRGERVHTFALNVSKSGMFVAAKSQDSGAALDKVEVILPLDDKGGPLRATAKVARSVGTDMNRSRRLPTGLGLKLSTSDEARYEGFVNRVTRRASHWVLVGGSEERIADLTHELSGAGYSASGASRPPALVERAGRARAPDLVVLDSSIGKDDARSMASLRRALDLRSVRTIDCPGGSAVAARTLVDQALLG